MFERPQHRSVLAVLGAFQADLLSSCRFVFGGGTRIVLDLEEYRESHDIDFLCSDASGYGDLRLVATQKGYAGLFTGAGLRELQFPREIRVDQYGVRFPVLCGETLLRVELIREARIELDPGIRPSWSPVDCLSLADCYAEKLLANSDRWPDRQVLSRDLVDLAALRIRCGPIPDSSWSKVRAAYRTAPEADLRKALAHFEQDPTYQQRCIEGLRMESWREELLRGLAFLRQDLS
jgi:hypothetical protein